MLDEEALLLLGGGAALQLVTITRGMKEDNVFRVPL